MTTLTPACNTPSKPARPVSAEEGHRGGFHPDRKEKVITMRAAFLLTLGCLTSIVTVPPSSYTGGWTVIEESDRQSSSVLVHYTPAHQWSVGPRVELNRDDDFALYSVQPTWLAKRWFGADYQGNLIFLVAQVSLWHQRQSA